MKNYHLYLIWIYVKNSSMSLSFTLVINEKVKHNIKIKTHKLIVLRFWVKNDVNILCSWALVSLKRRHEYSWLEIVLLVGNVSLNLILVINERTEHLYKNKDPYVIGFRTYWYLFSPIKILICKPNKLFVN